MPDTHSTLSQLTQSDDFLSRHVGPREAEIAEMLETVGVDSLGQLIDRAVPAGLRSERSLDLRFNLATVVWVADRVTVFD